MATRIDRLATQILLRSQNLATTRLVRIMNKAAILLRDKIKREHLGGPRTQAKRLARNTGKTEENTVARRAVQEKDGVSASVAINVKWASLDFGRVGDVKIIRPVNKQSLTIPLPGILGPDKRAVVAANSRQILNKFVKGGTLFGQLPGEIGLQSIRPLFRLKKSVTIPVRIDVKKDLEDWIVPQVQQMIDDEAVQVFQ